MGNRLYVGNLAYSTMDQQLQEAFSEFGEVTSASVVIDATVPLRSCLKSFDVV